MVEKALLVELDYKGQYERFAMTREEFAQEFGFAPPEIYGTETLRPLVHIWWYETEINSPVWERFFTDMGYGLPDSDIESGNLAYIRLDRMSNEFLKSILSENVEE